MTRFAIDAPAAPGCADAFVTLDADLARQLDGMVPLAPFEALLR